MRRLARRTEKQYLQCMVTVSPFLGKLTPSPGVMIVLVTPIASYECNEVEERWCVKRREKINE